MAIPSLLGSYIDQTYQRLVQTTGSGAEFADGLGNPISFGGATIPGGSNTQIQFNSASKFAADSSFIFDYTKKALVLGTGNVVYSPFSFALGTNHNLFGTGSFAQGDGNSTNANYTHVEGSNTYAGSAYAHAEGEFTNAYTYASHAEGYFTSTLGLYSHAEGNTSQAKGDYSHAEGNSTISSGSYSHAEGNSTIARGDSSHAEGINTQASADYSHAEGEGSIANGYGSHAEGTGTTALGYASHAEGHSTITTNNYAHAEGDSTVAGGIGSHAEGEGTYANGIRSHAEGFGAAANGDTSHAEGAGSTTFGQSSHAEGSGTVTNGDYSHAEGSTTTTYGDSSHSEGDGTATGQLGYNSTSIVAGNITLDSGYGNVKPYIDGLSGYIILDDRAHSNLYGYQLFKIGSITAGTPTIINLVDTTVSTAQATIGVPGVVAPTDSDTIITGRRAHSEGSNTIASGWSSHAAGDNTNTVGDFSYAGGQGTIAYRQNQTAVGQYNKIFRENQTHYDSSFVVGKGTSTSLRDNIFEVLPTQNTVNISASIVTIDGLTADNTVPNIVSIDTGSKQLYTISVSSIRPKAGSVQSSSFSGSGPKTCSVSFTTPFPDNNYAITVTGTDGLPWSIIGKTSGSFGISSNSGAAITGPVYWIATPFNNS